MTKYNPKYTRLVAQYKYTDEDGNYKLKDLPLYDCREEDWA